MLQPAIKEILIKAVIGIAGYQAHLNFLVAVDKARPQIAAFTAQYVDEAAVLAGALPASNFSAIYPWVPGPYAAF